MPSTMDRPSHRRRGLHGELVQDLGRMIVAGTLDADHSLAPDEIGQTFGVSRTVVREALRVLETKGLIGARPNTGTRVRPVGDWNLLDPDVIEWRALSPQRDEQIRELLELRRAVEPLAARLAAVRANAADQQRLTAAAVTLAGLRGRDAASFARADTEFHCLLARAAGSAMVEQLFRLVSSGLDLCGDPATGRRRPGAASADQHRRVAEAIADGDWDCAETAMRELLDSPRRQQRSGK